MAYFKYVAGNILESDAEALVNPVNCVGVMGRGLALQFKEAFPDNFAAYAAGDILPGKMFLFWTGDRYIINFPTKRHWRDKSRMADIVCGLGDLALVIGSNGIKSIAVPPLGCGLGGLDWHLVRPEIEGALGGIDGLIVYVYGTPQERG